MAVEGKVLKKNKAKKQTEEVVSILCTHSNPLPVPVPRLTGTGVEGIEKQQQQQQNSDRSTAGQSKKQNKQINKQNTRKETRTRTRRYHYDLQSRCLTSVRRRGKNPVTHLFLFGLQNSDRSMTIQVSQTIRPPHKTQSP